MSILEKVEIPTVLLEAEICTNAQQWRNLRKEYERKFEQLSEDQKLSKLAIEMNNTVSKFKFHLYFKTIPFRGLEL